MTNIVEGKNGLLRMQVFAIAYFYTKIIYIKCMDAWRIRLKIGVQKEKMKFVKQQMTTDAVSQNIRKMIWSFLMICALNFKFTM